MRVEAEILLNHGSKRAFILILPPVDIAALDLFLEGGSAGTLALFP
jgi:hypothetical protein